MSKLTPELVDEYFEIHLPYRTGILLAHFKMRHDPVTGTYVPWTGTRSWLDAGFVAALVTARLYLNVLGIAKDRKGTTLVSFKEQDDDITVDDLGGRRVSIANIAPADQKMLLSLSWQTRQQPTSPPLYRTTAQRFQRSS
jgi:hypothetical protein